MWMVVALLAIVAGSLLFHWVSPWWSTALASNWRQMDDTLSITLVITGLFFVVINLFVVYCLLRYRHREGRRAAYQPENKRLERWLIGVTALGIVALLTPGLVVYASYIKPPPDALVLEVVGQQWQWRFRFVGTADRLGASDARFIGAGNPLGLDPDDAAARANIVISGNEVHLPLNRPVRVLARSNDVLHDFFVPPMRARMNIVPGQVSSFWFTPTVAGRFEAMCAQLCGIGHPNMRGTVVVEDEAAFQAWLGAQPTFAALLAPAAPAQTAALDLAARGKALAQSKGCVGCHSVDGSPLVGPSWKGLFGKTETFADGSTALVDAAALRHKIREPQSRTVKGFPPLMPKLDIKDDELDALVAYIQSVH
ncbi:MAG: c-type cytochrome [Comamonadaceae bacterium]|jgi:cytochrome c oxidase subunit 2|nr:c-type cytochrome [Comamonadaceae bacterium]